MFICSVLELVFAYTTYGKHVCEGLCIMKELTFSILTNQTVNLGRFISICVKPGRKNIYSIEMKRVLSILSLMLITELLLKWVGL